MVKEMKGLKTYKKKHPPELKLHDWESLAEGDTLRVACSHPNCEGKKDAFTITKIIGGCVYNCYRCGTSGIFTRSSNPAASREYLRRLRLRRHNKSGNAQDSTWNITLPNDYVPLISFGQIIPHQALALVYRYELDDNDMATWKMGYSPKLERLIIPIYKGGILQAWEGKDIYYKRNKQLYEMGHLKRPPMKVYTEAIRGHKPKFFIYEFGCNEIVLVEDIFSAIKCWNKFKINSVALLNATLQNKLIEELKLRDYKNVYIWLDPDKRVESIQGGLRWNQLGVNTKAIVDYNCDPKQVPYNKMRL